jgi:hypothetical protein
MRDAILTLTLSALALHAAPRPKVRAITAFIDVDAQGYTHQIEDAARFLTAARETYRNAGWEVHALYRARHGERYR